MNRRNFWSALVGLGVAASVKPSPRTVYGDIKISFVLPNRIEPEQFKKWFTCNKGLITTAIRQSALEMKKHV